MKLKGSSFEFVKFYWNCHVTRFPWKPKDRFWQDLWILTLPEQTCYHGNRVSDFQKSSLFVEKFLKNQF